MRGLWSAETRPRTVLTAPNAGSQDPSSSVVQHLEIYLDGDLHHRWLSIRPQDRLKTPSFYRGDGGFRQPEGSSRCQRSIAHRAILSDQNQEKYRSLKLRGSGGLGIGRRATADAFRVSVASHPGVGDRGPVWDEELCGRLRFRQRTA